MITTVRIYPNEAKALEVKARAEAEGFKNVSVLAASPEEAETVIRKAVRDEKLPGSHARLCINSLAAGRAVVAVPTPFGAGLEAINLLNSFGPVDNEVLPPYSRRNAAPFSEFVGIPVLTKAKPAAGLSKSRFMLGEPKLSKKAAPFSSMLGLPTLTSGKSRFASGPVPKSNPAPFSSFFRIPTLSNPKGKATLFKEPAPFSSSFALPLLTKDKREDK